MQIDKMLGRMSAHMSIQMSIQGSTRVFSYVHTNYTHVYKRIHRLEALNFSKVQIYKMLGRMFAAHVYTHVYTTVYTHVCTNVCTHCTYIVYKCAFKTCLPSTGI